MARRTASKLASTSDAKLTEVPAAETPADEPVIRVLSEEPEATTTTELTSETFIQVPTETVPEESGEKPEGKPEEVEVKKTPRKASGPSGRRTVQTEVIGGPVEYSGYKKRRQGNHYLTAITGVLDTTSNV